MEEDPPTSGSDVHLVGTLDSVAEKKHVAMLDRLSNLHQSRLQLSAARRSEAAASPAFESVSSFLDRFSDSKRSIEVALQRCRAMAAEAADPASTSHLLKPELEKVAASIAELDQLVAENSYFLPAYEVRFTLKTISDLKEDLEKANAELLPRKKFSFRNKAAKKDPILLKEVEQVTPTKAESSNLAFVRESPGFRNENGAVLVKKFSSTEEGHGDFTLTDLNSCEIYLKGRFGSLFVHRLKDCRIFAGPVLGSIHIEEVTGCLFMLASHQIRIHEARATDFYLRVRSRPIIEDSNGVRFAPYALYYQGIDEELRDSGLGEETGNWSNVDDFKWLRALHSPNWSLVPDEELLGSMNITEIKKNPCEDK